MLRLSPPMAPPSHPICIPDDIIRTSVVPTGCWWRTQATKITRAPSLGFRRRCSPLLLVPVLWPRLFGRPATTRREIWAGQEAAIKPNDAWARPRPWPVSLWANSISGVRSDTRPRSPSKDDSSSLSLICAANFGWEAVVLSVCKLCVWEIKRGSLGLQAANTDIS